MKTYAIVVEEEKKIIGKYRFRVDAIGVCHGDCREKMVEIVSEDSIHLPSDEFIKSYLWGDINKLKSKK